MKTRALLACTAVAAPVIVNEFNAVSSASYLEEGAPGSRTTTVLAFPQSSFGAPNRWSGGASVQDFSTLRSVVVPEPGALALLGLAGIACARASARARRAA